MNLSTMTREELWALDSGAIADLARENKISLFEKDGEDYTALKIDDTLLEDLDKRRIKLQQDNADSRRETQEELTVDEEKQLKYDYAKASAKINPQDR